MMAQNEARRIAQEQLAQPHMSLPPAGIDGFPMGGNNPNLQPLGGARPPPDACLHPADPAAKRPKPDEQGMDPEFSSRLAALRGGGAPPPAQAQANVCPACVSWV
jgi:hypothetical protein